MSDKNNKKMIAVAFGFGIELVVYIVLSLFVGQWVGEKWGSGVIGATLGCFIGFSFWTWKIIRAQSKDTNQHLKTTNKKNPQ